MPSADSGPKVAGGRGLERCAIHLPEYQDANQQCSGKLSEVVGGRLLSFL